MSIDTAREDIESAISALRKVRAGRKLLPISQYAVKKLDSALAALSTIDPDAIRREILQKVAAEIKDHHDEVTWDDYEEGYKDGTENALAVVDAAIVATDTTPAILATEPAREGS